MKLTLSLLTSLALAAIAGAETWPFHAKPDPFAADALLDLRSLNEKQSGETGFVPARFPGGAAATTAGSFFSPERGRRLPSSETQKLSTTP